MKVLITGATGFLGRHVVSSLIGTHNLALYVREGSKVDLKNVHVIHGTLANLESNKDEIVSFSPDACIHLAWEGIPVFSPEICALNVYNSLRLLDLLFENTKCKQYIISGSCYEYGNAKGVCKEDDPAIINSYIAWAKHTINQYATLRCLEKKAKLYWLRCFYIFGPGQRKESIIPAVISTFLKNEKPIIKAPFNANDFIHVNDISRAMSLILERNPEPGIYNLGRGEVAEVVRLCEIIESKICNSTTFSDTLKNLDKPIVNKAFWADISKAKKLFGWVPQIGLEAGIEEMVNLIRSEMKC